MQSIARRAVVLGLQFFLVQSVVAAPAGDSELTAESLTERYGAVVRQVAGRDIAEQEIQKLFTSVLERADGANGERVASHSEFRAYALKQLQHSAALKSLAKSSIGLISKQLVLRDASEDEFKDAVAALAVLTLVNGKCATLGEDNEVCALKSPDNATTSSIVGLRKENESLISLSGAGVGTDAALATTLFFRRGPDGVLANISCPECAKEASADLASPQVVVAQVNVDDVLSPLKESLTIFKQSQTANSGIDIRIPVPAPVVSLQAAGPVEDLFRLRSAAASTAQIVRCYGYPPGFPPPLPNSEGLPEGIRDAVSDSYAQVIGDGVNFVPSPTPQCPYTLDVLRGNLSIAANLDYGLTASDTINVQVPFAFACTYDSCLYALAVCMITGDLWFGRDADAAARECVRGLTTPMYIPVNALGINLNALGTLCTVTPAGLAEARPGFIGSAAALEDAGVAYGTWKQVPYAGLAPPPHMYPVPSTGEAGVVYLGGSYLLAGVDAWHSNAAFSGNESLNKYVFNGGCTYEWSTNIRNATVRGDSIWLSWAYPIFDINAFFLNLVYEWFVLWGHTSSHDPILPTPIPTVPPVSVPSVPTIPPVTVPPVSIPRAPTVPPVSTPTVPPVSIPRTPTVPPVSIPRTPTVPPVSTPTVPPVSVPRVSVPRPTINPPTGPCPSC